VGFSYGDKRDYIDDEEGVGEDLYQFLQASLHYDIPHVLHRLALLSYGVIIRSLAQIFASRTSYRSITITPPPARTQAFFQGNPSLQGRPFYIFGER
jgi:hypothetical protein